MSGGIWGVVLAKVQIDIVTKVGGDNVKQASTDWLALASQVALAKEAFGLVGDVATKAYDAIKQGAQVQATATNFDKLTRSIGGAGDVLVKLRTATADMVDDTTLMANASQLLTMGLADNADALAKHFEIVSKLKKPTDDIASAMENWTLLLANQSIPRLDSFGISSGAVRDRINELRAANEGMNRETAFLIATLEQAEAAMGKVADQTTGTAADLARLEADWKDLTDSLKTGAAVIAGPVVSALADLARSEKSIEAVFDQADNIAATSASLEEYVQKLQEANVWVPDLATAEVWFAQANSQAAAAKEAEAYVGWLEKQAAANDATASSAEGLRTDVDYTTIAYQGARGSLEMLNVELRQAEIDQENAAAAAEELKLAQEEAALAAEAHARVMGGLFYDSITSAQTETKTLEERLFEQAAQAGASETALVLLAGATGNYTEEQIRAALEAAVMTEKINQVAAAVAAGDLTAQAAITTLQNFQTELQQSGNDSETTAGKVGGLKGEMDAAATKAMFLADQAKNAGGNINGLGGESENARPRLDGVGKSARGAALKMDQLRGYAIGAKNAINEIPSGKTFTLTVKTKGSISVPSGGGGGGGGGFEQIGSAVGGGGGGGGSAPAPSPPPPPPPPSSGGGGGGGGGGFQPLQHGGLITGGILGRDSVPAMLMPGERVLTVAQNRKFEEGKLGNNITIHMPINVGGGMGPSMGPDPQRLATAINQQAYDTLFRAFRRMGLAR